jgi:general secretion pathway protein G
MFLKSFKKSLGFTLVELLVTVGIIGVLATLLMANLVGMRSRARDTERKSDLKQIQKALEVYKQDRDPWSYPQVDTWSDVTTALETDGYMKEVPTDPYAGDYYYASPRTGSDTLTYEMFACLENASDADADSITQDDCDDASYTLTEP